MPAVSIAIPVYNGVRFIREAVLSALAQEHSPLEVVVCDNVSSDGTLEAIADLAADPRLRVVTADEHVPMAANWNRAARYARHDLVLMLSADDALLDGAIGKLAAPFSAANPPDLVFGDTLEIIEGSGRALGKPLADRRSGQIHDFEGFVVGEALSINVNAVLFRRGLVAFREDVGVVCDLELFIRLAKEGCRAAAIADPVTAYRQHPGALSANRERMWDESLHVYHRHAADNPRTALYRHRIFLTLMWLCAFLAERGESEKALAHLATHGGLLGGPRRALLAAISRFPPSLRLLSGLRGLRASRSPASPAR
jgi:glycosyltransferase involved in cell wall biosynthesis